MMGLFKALFSSGAVTQGLGLIDKAFYTDGEKAENFNKLLAAYEPFKLAQRFLALTLGLPFVFIHIVLVVCWMISIFTAGPGLEYKFIFEQLKLVAEYNNTTLGEPFFYVVLFYFGGGAVEGIVKRYKDVDKGEKRS